MRRVLRKQIVLGDVVSMMISFKRMLEALINCLDRDEGRESIPNEGSQCAPTGSSSIHRELEKVIFLEFCDALDDLAAKLENLAMCFTLRDFTSNMKVCMMVFQLKGSSLLWWKMLLCQLNMVIEEVTWELFEEWLTERYMSEEFIEHQLN
jgi:hypothetical protein